MPSSYQVVVLDEAPLPVSSPSAGGLPHASWHATLTAIHDPAPRSQAIRTDHEYHEYSLSKVDFGERTAFSSYHVA